jgi:glycosyltransferase involved in cell wall biosynthesis
MFKSFQNSNKLKAFLVIIIIFTISWILILSITSCCNFEPLRDLLINQEFIGASNIELKQNKLVQKGIIEMNKSNVTIVGACRNVGKHLKNVLKQLEELSLNFEYSRVIIVEGDSTDNTRSILLTWSKLSPHNRIIINSNGDKNIKENIINFNGTFIPREGRITIARNKALHKLNELTPTKYVIVIDLDIIGFNLFGVKDSFGRSNWDAICAHGIIVHGLYRDLYAFRIPGVNTNHHMGGKDHDLYNISKKQKSLNRKHLEVFKKLIL